MPGGPERCCDPHLPSPPASPRALPCIATEDSKQGSCFINWSQAKYSDLCSFASWQHVRHPPSDLDKPSRFAIWAQSASPGNRPGPHEELCIHTDGSFRPATAQGGWGAVLLKRQFGGSDKEGVLLGCSWGQYRDFHTLVPELDCQLDAHLMESLGLFWAAVMVIQLRHFGRVVFESDCQSALGAADGTCKIRDHPICRAMAAVHLCLRIVLPAPPQYCHVAGHSGFARNEMADALANYGPDGHQQLAPFCLDLRLWFERDADGFAWAPHAFLCKESPDSMPALVDDQIVWRPVIPAF